MSQRIALGALAYFGLAVWVGAQDFEALARRLPETGNALGLIDFKAILDAPLARAENWSSKAELINLPSSISRLALSGAFSPAVAQHEWRYGVAELTGPLEIDELARKVGGAATTIADRPALMTMEQMAFVQLAPTEIALDFAANRQDLTRWIRVAQSNTTLVLSEYLRDFVKVNAAAPIRFALDTRDLFDPAGVRRSLRGMSALANDRGNVERVAALIDSMRGISLTVRVNQDIRASLRLDFGREISRERVPVDEVLRAALKEQGLYLPDFDQFRTEVRGRSVFFEGTLSEAGLRQALTALLDTRHSLHSLGTDSAFSPGAEGLDSAVSRSRRYFNGVLNLIDDLRRQKRSLRTTREYAHWYEHTARRIDQLPLVGVDERLLDFGAQVAEKLRAMAWSLRGVRIDVNQLSSHRRSGSTAGGWGFGPGPGGVFFNNNFADVAQAQSNVVAAGARDRVALWSQIDAAIGQTRRDMSRQFGVEF
jgi:hypothetical protein